MKSSVREKQRKYYNYCVDVLKSDGTIWFVARFASKSVALVWCNGFRHGYAGATKAPMLGAHYVRYYSFKPEYHL